MSQPMCGEKSCAACRFSSLTEMYECIALETCMMDTGHCPFYKENSKADADNEAARIRVEKLGILAADGTYKQQRFVRARREEDKNGIPCVVTRPDIASWLEDLAHRGSIPMDVFNNYTSTHAV